MLTSTIFFLIPCLPFLYSVLWNLWCDVFIWTMSSCCPIGGGDNDICIIITYFLCFWWCHLLQQWIRYGFLDSIPFCGTNSPFSIILTDALMLIIVINVVQMVSLMMLMSRDWQSFLLLLLNNWCYLGFLCSLYYNAVAGTGAIDWHLVVTIAKLPTSSKHLSTIRTFVH